MLAAMILVCVMKRRWFAVLVLLMYNKYVHQERA